MVSITKTCSKEGCEKPHSARGLCDNHYSLWLQHSKSGYKSWQAMLQRCYNINNKAYPRYGGRGITVCDRWRTSYAYFINDMGFPPSTQHTIDRINTNGNYEPINCRWGTKLQQTLNRRVLKNNKSGFVGVSWNKRRGKWETNINITGVPKINLRCYEEAAEAAWIYDQFAVQIFGDDARLNFEYFPVKLQ